MQLDLRIQNQSTSQLIIISAFALAIANSPAQAKTAVLSCHLTWQSTTDSHTGKPVHGSATHVFVFETSPSVIMALSNDEYLKLKANKPNSWLRTVARKFKREWSIKKSDSAFEKEMKSYTKIRGPKITNRYISGAIINKIQSTVYYYYKHKKKELAVSVGSYVDPEMRYFYKCNELKYE